MGSPCGHFLLHFVIQLLTCRELSTCHILANVHFKNLCLTFTKRVVLYAFGLWLQKQKCKWVGPRGDKCYICSSDLKSSGRWKIWKLNSLLVWVFFLINSCNIMLAAPRNILLLRGWFYIAYIYMYSFSRFCVWILHTKMKQTINFIVFNVILNCI